MAALFSGSRPQHARQHLTCSGRLATFAQLMDFLGNCGVWYAGEPGSVKSNFKRAPTLLGKQNIL